MPVQHIALFSFKADTPPGTIDRVVLELRRLAKVIPGINSLTSGPNSSPEGLADGLTHGFVMTFQDAAARDAYLSHPEHEKFKTLALPNIEKVIVFDYEC